MQTYLLKPGRQVIGRAGDMNETAVAVNIAKWVEDYPAGIAQLMVTTPGGERVPLTVTVEDGLMVAVLPDTVTVGPGLYVYTAVITNGGTQVLTERYECIILGSELAKTWKPLGPRVPDWAERIFVAADVIERAMDGAIEARTTAVDAAASATASAEAAAASEGAAELSAQAAAASASDAQEILDNVVDQGAAQVSAIQEAGTAARESVPETYTQLSDDVRDLKSQLTNTTDKNIAYWGEYPFETRTKGSGASVVTLKRTLGAITADGTPTYNWFNKLNGEMMRTTATATVDAWEGIHLSAGHTYAIEMILVSGDTSRSENGDMVPSTSVYKEGTHSSVGTLSRPNRDTFIRTFTAEEGIAYNIVLYCPMNKSFNNATFTINLKDITIDLPTLEKIDNFVATGTYKSYGRKPLFESSCDVTSQKITIPYDGITSAASQGMTYYGGYVFIAQKGIKNGASSQVPYLHILSFDGTTLTFVRSIPLPVGSLSPADITFHSNCLSFANSPASGQTYPLLYVTMMWNSVTYNGNNECFVYQLSNDLTSATLEQQIYYQGDQTEDIRAYSSDFLIDERGYLWMLGNTDIMTETGSYGRFLKQFMIPDTSEPLVVLSKSDVIKEYMLNEVLYSGIGLATYQGGTIKNGLLVTPTSGTGAALVVIDVDTGELVNYTPITFTSKEFEDVFLLNGKAHYNTADNYFFTQTFLN